MFQWLFVGYICTISTTTQRVRRFSFITLTSLLMMSLHAAGLSAGVIPAPEWTVSESLITDDGYVTLQWRMPEGESAAFYKITEEYGQQSKAIFVEGTGLRAYRTVPGRYQFVLQACTKDVSGIPDCGSMSDALTLRVTDQVVSSLLSDLPQDSGEDEEGPAVEAGPEVLQPGLWYNPEKDGHGWSFYWANRLALPENDPLFGNGYDLVGIWYTFEAKFARAETDCPECPPIVGNYRPVVLKLKAMSTAPGTFGGGLYVSRSDGSEVWVGGADVIFGPDDISATVNWGVNFKKENLSASDPLVFIHGSDPADTNSISHLSGVWNRAGEYRYYIVTDIGSSAEAITVVFHDNAGDPTWVQAVNNEAPGRFSTSFCLAYLKQGYPPSETKPLGWTKDWHQSGCDSLKPAGSENRNGLRYFIDSNAYYWADFVLPVSTYVSGSVNIGSNNAPMPLYKAANFHAVSYVSASGSSCELAEVESSCNVTLNWYTDGNYPNATVYARNNTSGSWRKVLTSTQPVMEDISYSISEAGRYEFELHMGDSVTSTLMARSDEFTVTSNIANSPPVLTSPGDQINQQGDNVELQVVAIDPDEGDVLDFDENGLPPGLEIDHETGRIFGVLTADAGEYEVSISVVDNHGNGDSALFIWRVINTDSNPEVPPNPAAPPDMSANASSSGVGATPAEFRVNESGSATYSIPILAAPASGGVQPKISLNYSSHFGNGDVGVGWSLGGLSVIGRCAQTMEQDGISISSGIKLNDQDRFCLDGQRLIVDSGSGQYGESGTEYRTEIDNFSRITSFGAAGNGPAWFRVERRDGSVLEYGNSMDSRIEARGSANANTVISWAQNRFEDRSGNYILYRYRENSAGPVAFAPEAIEYSANASAGVAPGARITFAYSDRDSAADLTHSYVGGVQVEQGLLLQSIQSQGRRSAGDPFEDLRFYDLSYESDGMGRSILTTLTECRTANRLVCYKPTRFSWLKSEHAIDSTASLLDGLLPKNSMSGLLMADVSGDGRPDLLYTELKKRRYYLKIKSATENATFNEWNVSYELPKKSDGLPPRVFSIDLNSDGFQDVVYSKYSSSSDDYAWVARLSNGSGLEAEILLNPDYRYFLDGQNLESRIQIMDFNGDGMSDILHTRTDAQGTSWSSAVLLNTSTADGGVGLAAPITIDIDNADLFPFDTGDGWEMSTRPPYYKWGNSGAGDKDVPDTRVFDFNADGAVDLLLKVWRQYQKCIENCKLPASGSGSKEQGKKPKNPDPVYQYAYASFWVLMESNGQNVYQRHSIIALGSDCTILLICGDPAYSGLPNTSNIQPVDLNADGLADLAWGDPGNSWYFQLNNGLGFEPPQFIGQVPSGLDAHVRFEDWNGDSYPDLIYPSAALDNNASWLIRQNHFGREFAAESDTGVAAGNVGGDADIDAVENDASVFADFDGDGKSDQLLIDVNTSGEILSSHMRKGMNVSGSRAVEPANVITTITNGFNALTKIDYLPLTDQSVYTRMQDSAAVSWGNGAAVYDYIAPIFVVSQVASSSPTFSAPLALSKMEYHYVGAKIQAGGRGVLGFAEIIVYDPQLNTRANTRYRQDFPFSGLPVDTTRTKRGAHSKFKPITDVSSVEPVVWPAVTAGTLPPAGIAGTLLSYNVSQWKVVATVTGAWSIDPDVSLTRNYTLSGSLESKVFTQNSTDNYGNLTQSIVSTFEGNETTQFAKRSIRNSWSSVDLSSWDLGRMISSTATHSRNNASPVVRKSAFEYGAVSRLMTKETIEPGNSSLEITTTFGYDSFGNRTTTSRKGVGMTARGSSVAYDPLGRFVIRESNALGQTTVKTNQWDIFGNALETENIDGVVTLTGVDLMGRVFASYNQTGTWQMTLNSSGTGTVCPAGTAWRSTSRMAGDAISYQCFDIVGRKTRSVSRSINNQLINIDQYYDASGRPDRVSEPYFSNETRYWNETSYDAAGRITGELSAAGDDISAAYDDRAVGGCAAADPGVIVTTNALGQRTTEVKNVLGETIESYDDNCGRLSFDYDSMGNMTSVTGADGTVVRMSYDGAGRKTALYDADKGNWKYAYNSLAELTLQLDAKKQAISFEYDALGRVTDRRELNGVDSLLDTAYSTINHETTSYRAASPGKSKSATIVYRQGESAAVIHQQSMSYDGLGRLESVVSTIENNTFYQQTSYDEYGRVFQKFDASGNDSGLRYAYRYGHLIQLKEAREGVNGIVYQNILEMDARGNVTKAALGNGVIALADYDPAGGRLTRLSAYDQQGVELQQVDYLFDVLGNLKKRHDLSGGIDFREDYSYDGLNRLKQVRLTAADINIPSPIQTLAVNYDEAGNITWKSDLGEYSYGAGSAGPHSVTSAGGASYSYDANGNQTGGDGRSIGYTVFDKAATLVKGKQSTTFTYGIGNKRVIREDAEEGVLKKSTVYLGSVEYITRQDGSAFFKRHLGGVAVANYYPVSYVQQTSYLLKDHIGSVHTVLNEMGLITTRMHFSAFGERQDLDWQTPLDSFLYAPLNDITNRGFTGHEHVDSIGIINMNGRIYDAKLGRFLQADPFVQSPKNTQSLNRYSYVLNNPLSYTDPSGFFSLGRFIKRWGPVVAAVILTVMLPGAGGILATQFGVTHGFAQAVITGFIAGGITGGIKGAVKGAFVAAVTYGVTVAYNQQSGAQVELNERALAPTEQDLQHMLGTTSPEAGKYWVEPEAKGAFERVRRINAGDLKSGNTILINGVDNDFYAAVRNGTTHIAQIDGKASAYVLNFNPTNTLGPDLFETTRDMANTYFGFGQTELAEDLARMIDTASKNGIRDLRIIGHSQGAAITTSALRFAAGTGLDMSAVGSVNLHGAPINDLFVRNSLARRTGLSSNQFIIRAQFGDPVHAIFGANFISNPLDLLFSAIRIPQLFSPDATLSPHTVPCFGGRTALCSG